MTQEQFKHSVGIKARLTSTLSKLRLLYLAIGLCSGLIVPYLTNLLIHQGLTSSDVGWVMAIGTFISILLQPISGMLVDKYQNTRLVLGISILIPGLVVFFYNTHALVIILVMYTISQVFVAIQPPVADSYAVDTAIKEDKSYGSIRCFTSIGNAFGGYLGGLYLAAVAISKLWIPVLFMNSLAALIVTSLPKKQAAHMPGLTLRSGIGKLFRNSSFILFLIGCFLINQTLTAFNTFFVLSFQQMGGSYDLTAIALLIASMANMPAMLAASSMIRKFGKEKVLIFAAIAYIIRWAVQWLFPIPEVVLLIQPIHGLSFGLFYATAVEYVATVSGKHMRATGQSIFNMVFVGAAGIFGNLVNGYLIQHGGFSVMYFACTISAISGALCLLYVVKWRDRTTSA